MPIHDWTRVDAGIFHHFHHAWIEANARTLNRLLRGTDYYALAEQVAGGLGPDVLTLQRPLTGAKIGRKSTPRRPSSAVALAESPPKARFRITDAKRWYAGKKNSVVIRHVSEHNVIAVLEVVSPGNKASRAAINDFVHKAHELLLAGIHFALVDLFPPTRRDPQGIHPILWSDEDDDTYHFDPTKPLTCASYRAGPLAEAFVDTIGVGDELPDLPVFLVADEYVPVPLEATYQAAFEAVPDVWREALTSADK
jgi:hypothetical protein